MNWNLKVKLKSVKMIQKHIYDSDNDIEYVPDSVDDSDPEDEEISIRTTTKQKTATSTPKKERATRLQSPEAETIPGPSHAQLVPPAKPRARKNKYSMTLLKLHRFLTCPLQESHFHYQKWVYLVCSATGDHVSQDDTGEHKA